MNSEAKAAQNQNIFSILDFCLSCSSRLGMVTISVLVPADETVCVCMDVWKQARAGVFCACLSGRCIQDRGYGLCVRCCAGCSISPCVRPRRARAACIHSQKCASRFVRLVPRIIKLHSIFTLYRERLRRFSLSQRWYDLLTIYSPCPRALTRSGSVRDTESTGGKSLEEDSSSRLEEKGKGTVCAFD